MSAWQPSTEMRPWTANHERRMHLAERRSTSICQVCGKPGRLDQENGWWSTLCDEHRESTK